VRIALIATVVCAAAARAADSSGRYSLENVHEMASDLLLKPDGRFEFILAYGAADYWGKGGWRKQDGAVILDTDADETAPPFRLLASSDSKREGLRIVVLAPGARPVPNIDVVLDSAAGAVRSRTDSEGIAAFTPAKGPASVAFRIPVYQFESQPFALDPAHNEFRFEIDGRAITQVRFNNEKLAIDGNALVMRHWDAGPPMRYVKQ